MAANVEVDLDEIFSILPAEKARDARNRSIEALSGSRDPFPMALKWANFELNGAFIDGGRSDIGGVRSVVIKDGNQDPDVERLSAFASGNGALPGQIEFSAARGEIIWFVPVAQADEKGRIDSRLRGLVIPESLFCDVLDLFNASERLTGAEKHMAFQLAAGLSLKSAAQVDALSVETKRAQTKSLYGKLQCSGQTDLVRLLLGQLTYLITISDQLQSQTGLVTEFLDKHLLSDTRLLLQRLPNGRKLVVLEKGPINGQPVLLLHGMLWPLIFTHALPILEVLNLRVIVPLRSGYLDSGSPGSSETGRSASERDLEDIAAFQRLTLQGSVPVIGLSYGGPLAVRYAAQYPELASRLCLISLNAGTISAANAGFIGRMFGALRSVSSKNAVFRYISWQFRRYYTDEKTVAQVLRKMFEASHSDIEVIEGRAGGKPASGWFVDLYQNSISGIADDFACVMGDWDAHLGALECPVHFIHGKDDPLIDTSEVERFAAMCSVAEMTLIDGAGHHAAVSHPEAVWTAFAARSG